MISLDPPGPRRHHQHPVGQQHRLVDAVGDEQHRLARRQPQLLEVDPQLLAGQRVERAERLVHQQERRVVDQRAHDRGALLHAARELVRVAVLELGEADRREQLAGAGQMVGRGQAAQLDLHQHVAEHRPPVEQDRLLEDDAELGKRAGDRDGRRSRPGPRPAPAARRPAAASVLLPQPDGPTIARNSLAPDREADVGERMGDRRRAAEDLADAFDDDRRLGRSGPSARVRRERARRASGSRSGHRGGGATGAGTRWCRTRSPRGRSPDRGIRSGAPRSAASRPRRHSRCPCPRCSARTGG